MRPFTLWAPTLKTEKLFSALLESCKSMSAILIKNMNLVETDLVLKSVVETEVPCLLTVKSTNLSLFDLTFSGVKQESSDCRNAPIKEFSVTTRLQASSNAIDEICNSTGSLGEISNMVLGVEQVKVEFEFSCSRGDLIGYVRKNVGKVRYSYSKA